MKTLLLTSILCVSCCLGSLAQTSPQAPPTRPLSLSATDPVTLQAFVRAADTLRARAAERITALTGEIAALDSALASSGRLSRHDAQRAAQLQTELLRANADLNEADRVFSQVRQQLPRRYRKRAEASAQALYECIIDYGQTLKARSGKFFLVGTVVGTVFGIFLKARLL